MTDEEPPDHGTDSRRTFMKKSALASAAAGLGVSGVDATARGTDDDDDDQIVNDTTYRALMFVDQFQPGAKFVIVSPVVDWTPDVPEVRDNIPADYNTRVVRYLNVDLFRILYMPHDAEIPPYAPEFGYVVDDRNSSPNGRPAPQVYQLHRESGLVEGTDQLMRDVTFSPLEEDVEEKVLDNEDWWQK